MVFHNKFCLLLLIMVILSSCSIGQKNSSAKQSAEQLIRFVETGDTTLLAGLFTDSVLNLMTVEAMLDTRQDFVHSFGKLQSVDAPEFPTDSTANIVLRYEEMSLLTSLEFDSIGKIRFLSIQPEPVKLTGSESDIKLTDISDFREFREAFSADSQYVRLISILSPT